MDKFDITRTETVSPRGETIVFQAINKDGEIIFGARAELEKFKNFSDNKWDKWRISYGTNGSQTYEEKLPYVAVINAAMNELQKLN